MINLKKPFAVLASLLMAGAQLSAPAAAWADTGTFSDNFSSYAKGTCMTDGAAFGSWSVAFAGFGCATAGSDALGSYLQISPMTSATASQTHAILVLGPSFSQPSTYSVNMRTVSQLRVGSTPNPWEVGWFVWNYADNYHFYYFEVKPNGWELGKEDPAYPGAQRFLASGPSPAMPIGTQYALKVAQTSYNSVSVYVNGQLITSFTDNERPYSSGRIGFYNEDSVVRFSNMAVAPTGTATSGTTAAATASPAPTASPTPAVTASGAPSVSVLTPSSVPAGYTAFNIAVDGTGFTSGSYVMWNGVRHPGTVQGSTRIVAYVAAADVAAGGTAQVAVATPGLPNSNAQTFTVTGAGATTTTTTAAPPTTTTTASPTTTTTASAAPVVSALSPTSVKAGSTAFNIAVDGSHFTSGSVVQWNGVNCPGTVQSGTRIVAYVSPANVSAAGTGRVTVYTPGAGTSNAATFTVLPKS